jgi:ribose 5-phosphate isomerase A
VTDKVSEEDLATLGKHALKYVKPGFKVGIGTGKAASAFIRALGRSGLKICAVPTSERSAELAREVGIELGPLAGELDIALDGADEVDPNLDLIKGFGGALLREKIVAAAARYYVILVSEEKLVQRLGKRGWLPVEVLPFGLDLCARRIADLGMRPQVRRLESGESFLTDNGNLILDCAVDEIAEPARLERELAAIPGVLGSGLFVGTADEVLVCAAGGKITSLTRQGKRTRP